MAKRSLILTSTSAKGNTLSKSITDINPKADDAVLKTFAQKLNNMTTNTYVRTDCVDKFNVDTEGDLRVRQMPTLSLKGSLPAVSSITSNPARVEISYTGDGEIYAYPKTCKNIAMFILSGHGYLQLLKPQGTDGFNAQAGTFILGAHGTDNYKPVEVEYTLE